MFFTFATDGGVLLESVTFSGCRLEPSDLF